MSAIPEYRDPVLIYNPVAGKFRRNPHRVVQRALTALGRAGIAPREIPTARAGHATELARAAVEEGADLVVVLGGDGTINEAANGMVHSSVPLGVLPGGTANVMSMELGLGSRLDRAAQLLAASPPRDIAIGRILVQREPPRYFLMMCGAGLDARIVFDINPSLKAAGGKLAYWVSGLGHIRYRVEPLKVAIGKSSHECGFALFSRVRNYGGDLEIASGASLLKNTFEAVTFEGSNPFRYAWYMSGVLLHRVQRMRGVRVISCEKIEVFTDAHLQVDGEYVGRGPATVEIVPAALRLLVPPSYGSTSNASHG